MSKRRETKPDARSDQSQTASASPWSFELRYTRDAAADIKQLDGSVQKKLRKILEKKLAVDPEGCGLPLRHPLTNFWKHEFGGHRIVYRVYREHRAVVICAVGVRKQGDAEDVYRQLQTLAKTGRVAAQLAEVLKQLLPPKE